MRLKLYNDNTNRRDVERVVRCLKDGGLIIYPTDTVYAIGCDIFNVRGIEAVCRHKGVEPRKANLSFICDDLSMVSNYAKMDNAAFKLMKRNLPGPFTFILEGNSRLPKLFKQRKTVGIRIPDNNIIRAIVSELGNPILTTSLKRDDDEILEYYTDPELIDEKFGGEVDLVIDGGIGTLDPSTVVDCTGGETEIVRQGKAELQE
ncbi:MAG: threonylcarbamoyl-AMP synthase [Paludibacteraceae bacterium]|nr:threonylcarbamoyl-AMP synthase [Paludibacteraceae bacterium]